MTANHLKNDKVFTLSIFVNRKIISYDTILPFIYELNCQHKNAKIEIWFPDKVTYEAIKKNYFLYKTGRKMGNFFIISNSHLKGINAIFYKLFILVKLTLLAIKSQFTNVYFIHFKLLDFAPFHLLKLINAKRTFLAENFPYGYTQLQQDINYFKHVPFKLNNKNKNLLEFSGNWLEVDKYNKNIIKYGIPKKSKNWINLIEKKAAKNFKEEFKKLQIKNEAEIISIMLGTFGFQRHQINNKIQIQLVEESLETISSLKIKIPIFVKPHIITDMAILKRIVKNFNNLRIFITYLHPMILATRSRVVICYDYTTTLNDFHIMDVKTIEYAGYSKKALRMTKNGSVRPDYVDFFINKDKEKLKKTISSIFTKKRRKKVKYEDFSKVQAIKKFLI